MHWQPILIGFLSLRSGLAAKPVRGSARPAAARAVDWRKRRRVVPRRGAMEDLRQRGAEMIVPPGPKSQSMPISGKLSNLSRDKLATVFRSDGIPGRGCAADQ